VRPCVLLALAAACGNSGQADDKPAPAVHSDHWECEQLPFAQSTPVPEASGAGWLTIDGKPELVVVGDSGQAGAYGIVDPDTGETREQGRLPLGDAGDDIEGVAGRGDRLYGLTSAGWMRVWKRDGQAFTLVDGPYAIGEGTMICDKNGVNCARNYEGLCLAPATGGCVGYAASKKDGTLYCLTEHDGKLAVQRDGAIHIAETKRLADCAYGDDGSLWAANNLFGLSQVYRVEAGKVVPVAQLGAGFPEVIAVRGEIVYRMSDAGGSPSLMAKFRCRPPSR
jgi:hypothetical protein